MIIKHSALRRRWSELDQLKVDDLVNNPRYTAGSLGRQVDAHEVGYETFRL